MIRPALENYPGDRRLKDVRETKTEEAKAEKKKLADEFRPSLRLSCAPSSRERARLTRRLAHDRLEDLAVTVAQAEHSIQSPGPPSSVRDLAEVRARLTSLTESKHPQVWLLANADPTIVPSAELETIAARARDETLRRCASRLSHSTIHGDRKSGSASHPRHTGRSFVAFLARLTRLFQAETAWIGRWEGPYGI